MKHAILMSVLLFSTMTAQAYKNEPCSGSKGGVLHCEGPRFMCVDGSYSQSKRNCEAERGGSQKPSAPVQSANTSSQLSCLVVGISDGDTLTARCDGQRDQIKVRLGQIDAPEKAQDFGARSKESLAAMCFQKRATLRIETTDRYGRTVARVECDGRDANLEQVKAGMAWAYKQYLTDQAIQRAEDAARSGRLGLWSSPNPTPPWEFRRASKR